MLTAVCHINKGLHSALVLAQLLTFAFISSPDVHNAGNLESTTKHSLFCPRAFLLDMLKCWPDKPFMPKTAAAREDHGSGHYTQTVARRAMFR